MRKQAVTAGALLLGLAVIQAPAMAAEPGPEPRASAGDTVQLAQLQLNFGISDAEVMRSLRRAGFSEIEIYYRGLTKARVRACKNGIRYQMEVAPNGHIKSSAEIGKCRTRIDIEQARDILRQKGYREIVLNPTHGGGFEGNACRGRDRVELQVGPYGKVREAGVLGRCRQLLTRKEVALRLRADGYHRLKFDERPPPPFIVEACKGTARVKLLIVGNGRIMRTERIGRCGGEINPAMIATILQNQGYTRVRVTDDTLPRYAAEACRGEVRYEIIMNRYGDVRDRRRIGRCAPPLTREQLLSKLKAEKYYRIEFVDGPHDGFMVEACFGKERFRIEFSRYGETRSEDPIGSCESPRIGEVMRDFRDRGMDRVKVYIEGCRRGRRIRVELDEFGERVGRERLGRCR